eukprot:gene21904-27981_t
MAYGPEETVSYANYFMPSRFSITTRIFNELKTVSPNFKPKRIVDFGCGPATAGTAAFNVWGSEGTAKYTGIDMSQSMIDAAKIMTRDTIADCVFWDKSSEVIKRAESRQERFDLAVISYSLSDFTNDPTRRAAIQILFELLDVGGYLVVIEPGNPKGSNMARTARQFVIDTFNNVSEDGKALCLETSTYLTPEPEAESDEEDEDEDPERAMEKELNAMKNAKKIAATRKVKKEQYTNLILPAPPGYTHNEIGAYVVAPCTHDRPCPLAEGQWCSFSQKVYSGMIRKASEEKFSYVVIQKRPKPLAAPTAVDGKKKKNAPVSVPFQPKLFKEPKNHKAIREGVEEPPAPFVEKKSVDSFDYWTAPGAVTVLSSSGSSGEQQQQRTDPTPLNVLKRFSGIKKDDVQEVVDVLLDEVDWDEYNPPLHREEYGRIVRSPIKSRGHITMDLCVPSGHITRNVLSKGNLVAVPALYGALRKTTWGGLFPALIHDQEKSPLTIRSKGLGGPVGEVGGHRKSGGDDNDEEEEEEEEAPKSKKINSNIKRKPPPTAEEIAAKEDLKRKNAFTGRPLNSKTFYPKIEPIEKVVRKPFKIVDAPMPPQQNANADRAEQTGRTVGRRRHNAPLLKKPTAKPAVKKSTSAYDKGRVMRMFRGVWMV